MKWATTKPVNYDKVKEITQGSDENPYFLSRLSEAFFLYTNLGPDCREGQSILAMHFISQSDPDIQCILQKLEKSPQSPRSELVNMAFKVFNNHD